MASAQRVACSVGAIVFVSLMAGTITAQSSTTTAPGASATPPTPRKTPGARTPRSVPRTPWGKPDLQGVWDRHTITPLERPNELSGKANLSDEEAADLEQQTAARQDADRNRAPGTEADVSRAYNEFWWDHPTTVVGTKRTSLVIDPSDGRIPSLTSDAQARATLEPMRPAFRGNSANGRGADSWLDRSTWERCITQGLPKLGGGAYNANFQIFQTPDTVAILDEMIHEVRVIPLDGRPPLNPGLRQWLGTSRGHWEGDTLIVETGNFTDNINFRGSGEHLHLVERYTRVDADTLLYEVTVSDPTTWTEPWTVQLPVGKTHGKIYEYACHEGNYGLEHILSGARAKENAAAEERKRTELK